jgi:hypothetical protein
VKLGAVVKQLLSLLPESEAKAILSRRNWCSVLLPAIRESVKTDKPTAARCFLPVLTAMYYLGFADWVAREVFPYLPLAKLECFDRAGGAVVVLWLLTDPISDVVKIISDNKFAQPITVRTDDVLRFFCFFFFFEIF